MGIRGLSIFVCQDREEMLFLPDVVIANTHVISFLS